MGKHRRRRGELVRWGSVVLVDLDPAQGSEANKIRPAVVVCNDRAIEAAERNRRGVLAVLPITTSVGNVFPFQVRIADEHVSACGLVQESKIQAEQIRAVTISRITRVIGELPAGLHEPVRRAIRLQLNL